MLRLSILACTHTAPHIPSIQTCGAGVVANGAIGATKTVTDGTFDGADVTLTAVSGNSVEALVIYHSNAGAAATSRLIAYLDTGVTNLPFTPNGGDVTITWDAAGIFTL